MQWSDKSKGIDALGSCPSDAPIEGASGVGFSGVGPAQRVAAARREFVTRKGNNAPAGVRAAPPKAHMSGGARHERAGAQSCQLAQKAADIGDFQEALAWLLRQGHNGTPRTRGRFQQRIMRRDCTRDAEELTGREVVGFMSDNHIDPDIAVEVFILAPTGGDRERDPVRCGAGRGVVA